MQTFVAPAAYALFVWWFSTGVIILLDNLPRRTFRWSMPAGSVVAGLALWQLWVSGSDVSAYGAYAGFTCGLLVWGWHEMSFFMGYVTGPRRIASPPGATVWRRFGHGVAACLWHELAILLTAALVVAATWHAPNQAGLWTFMALWGARQSAKLNVFLGVRNLNEHFLPPHLRYLASFMAVRPVNLLFPACVTLGTILTAWLALRAASPGLPRAAAMSYTFVATMLALAVIEHWFLVLPLPFARLWNWALALRQKRPAPYAPALHGPTTHVAS